MPTDTNDGESEEGGDEEENRNAPTNFGVLLFAGPMHHKLIVTAEAWEGVSFPLRIKGRSVGAYYERVADLAVFMRYVDEPELG